uniref:Nicastrin n=2 Tax=Odontella aurita TaxID=265563 RepID=A0A7S4IVG1_9STRA
MTGRLLHWSAVIIDDEDGSGKGVLKAKVPPYVAVVEEEDYTTDSVEKLLAFAEEADKVYAAADDEAGAGVLRGVLVINSTASAGDSDNGENNDAAHYSPDPQTPRGYGTPSENLAVGPNYAWNPNGDALALKNMYGLPAGYIPDSSVSSAILEAAKEQGSVVAEMLAKGRELSGDELYPAINAEFNYYMGGSDLNSKDCLGWRDVDDGTWNPKCLPLGGNSVWAAAGTPEGSSDGGDAAADDGGRRKLEDANANADDDDGKKPVVLLATNLDSTSMFHDASPGANSAASNVLALLLAAKLLGSNVDDAALDALPNRPVFAFFQSETYGFVGSRAFLRDVAYPGFSCDEGASVPASIKKKDSWMRQGCLHPFRTSLDFQNLGKIKGMISVDQVGVLSNEGNFYVHGGQNVGDGDGDGGDNGGDDGDGDGNRRLDGDGDEDDAFLANVLLQLGSDDYTISSSSVEKDDDDGEYPLPPTPLTSLVKLSGGAAGGAVLAGYDDAFAGNAYYHSHLDLNSTARPINLDSIAAASTALARAALAASYDDGTGDYEGAAQYASDLIPALSSSDDTLEKLARCLLEDGNCDFLVQYGKVERANIKQDTGTDLGMGTPLGTPPTYYPGVYDSSNGQGFVQVGTGRYGSYTGEEEYGKSNADAFLLRPSLLESAVHGLLNDFLGRGGSASSGEDGEEGDGDGEDELISCEGTDDCSSVPYCSSSPADRAVCTGSKKCVCSRSNYHPALDEALIPAPNNFTGFFLVRDGEDENDDADEGVSAMYTEPFWSWKVGVTVYRDAGGKSGNWALGMGLAVAIGCATSAWLVKARLGKEKLY